MGIGDWFNETVTKMTGKTPQQHADALKSALPAPASKAMTDSSVNAALDAVPEPAGMTMTGGRRRKTRGGKRGPKKTRRGGKRH